MLRNSPTKTLEALAGNRLPALPKLSIPASVVASVRPSFKSAGVEQRFRSARTACETVARCGEWRALQVSSFAADAESAYQAIVFAMRATACSRFCIDVANEMRR